MSLILWILPLVGGMSQYKMNLEYSRQLHRFNSNITKSKVAQIRKVNIFPFPKVDAKFGQELVLSCTVEDHLLPPSLTWLQVERECVALAETIIILCNLVNWVPALSAWYSQHLHWEG